MADGKKSFVIYCDSINIVEKLSDDRAGKLFKHIFRYCSDLNPECSDEVIDMAFEHFKSILKRDLVKYDEKREKNRENILKRWNKENTTVYDSIPTNTKHTVTVTDTVTDTDILLKKETKANIKDRELKFKDEVRSFKSDYDIEMLKSFFNYWTEPNAGKTKMRFEMQKTFDVGRRLITWKNNNKTFEAAKPKPNTLLI